MLILKNGNVLPVRGKKFKGDIAVDGGKIVALGKELEKKYKKAEVIDVSGMTVTPGIIDAHCHVGMWEDGMGSEGSDGNDPYSPITPELRSIDGINPHDRCFREACDNGVTTVVTGPGSANVIGGQFVALKTLKGDIDDMILKFPLAMKAAMGENPKRVFSGHKTFYTRMAVAAQLRKALSDAVDYDKKIKAAGDDESKLPKKDHSLEALLPVIRRELPLKIHAHRSDDIMTAIRIAREFNIRFTLDHCTEGYMFAADLKKYLDELGAGIIIGPHLSNRSKIELRNNSFEAPCILKANGVKFAIMTDHPVIPVQYLPVCAALAVREGLDEITALEAITINAAEIVGIGDRVGSIEVGKDADIAVFSAHPFDYRAKCMLTLINGKIEHNTL
ncbi:MAG: amidohydrolase [Clostridia bacterium]|nr:amidohydrolase [Clostridia bacterium]